MRSLRWGLALLLMVGMAAVSSASWADPKFKTKDYDRGWYDHYDRGAASSPPGWDKGKKTGWRGRDLPPGQAKKFGQRYDRNYDPYYERGRYERQEAPDYIPVPVPIPVR